MSNHYFSYDRAHYYVQHTKSSRIPELLYHIHEYHCFSIRGELVSQLHTYVLYITCGGSGVQPRVIQISYTVKNCSVNIGTERVMLFAVIATRIRNDARAHTHTHSHDTHIIFVYKRKMRSVQKSRNNRKINYTPHRRRRCEPTQTRAVCRYDAVHRES